MKTDPNQTLAELKAAAGKRAHRNLDVVHEVCRTIHVTPATSGSRDYSLATVGRKTQERGGPTLNTLYAPLGKRFRTLIAAWAAWAGTTMKKPPRPVDERSEDGDLLRAIKDPALCSMIGFRLAEAKRCRAELDTLKANTKLVIDRRPRDGTRLANGQQVLQLLGPSPELLPTERDALQIVASAAWLARHGYVAGPDGEVLARNGATVLPIGFLTAVRKLAGGSKIEPCSSKHHECRDD